LGRPLERRKLLAQRQVLGGPGGVAGEKSPKEHQRGPQHSLQRRPREPATVCDHARLSRQPFHGAAALAGTKPMEVSIHPPQLHPPPPSGDNTIPAAGIVLSQQSGRNLSHVVTLPVTGDHMPRLPIREMIAPFAAA